MDSLSVDEERDGLYFEVMILMWAEEGITYIIVHYGECSSLYTCLVKEYDGFLSPCPAELFVSIFHSFEAGIANAISSFKWKKNNIVYEKIFISQIELLDELPQDMWQILVVFYLVWKRIYTVLAAQMLCMA